MNRTLDTVVGSVATSLPGTLLARAAVPAIIRTGATSAVIGLQATANQTIAASGATAALGIGINLINGK